MDIDKASHKIRTTRLIRLSEAELKEVVLVATNHHLKASFRFTDGALSISYKFAIKEDPDIRYVVQLRHQGNVTSMNLLMSLISSTIDQSILPLPAVYPIPGQEQRQKTTGFGRQITRLIPGPMANSVGTSREISIRPEYGPCIPGCLAHSSPYTPPHRRTLRYPIWRSCHP